ncbi:DUF3482 domain-containing protein [Glutamicibacter sp. MNS18]|uniref:DUF3482 domain-containing protein n=1 Tax=Glutamicibacter sp. MNS18 TaxID=2989817 RepID=UPI0022354791|nr:DUF3482 domain-containing protein [Glutamicibacter sp. MNS18]MCW4463988.1 DUF3482 domain-containing protein [Glutamicibacter sp. MNS18]
MEQNPSRPHVSPQGGGQPFEVDVHSSPKLWPMLITGGVTGALAGAVIALLGEPSANYTVAATLGFFAAMCAAIGLAVAAVVYLVIDRVTAKRTTRKVAVPLPESGQPGRGTITEGE